MNEQDIFDIMSGLPEKHIAEAAEWKYRHQSDAAGNEIDTLFTNAAEKEAARPKPPEKTISRVSAPPEMQGSSVAAEVQPNIMRHSVIGLTAIAAALVLAVGGIVLKLHSDRSAITDPGTAASTEYTVTSDPVVSESAVPTHNTTTDAGEQVTENTVTTTVTFAADAAPVPHHEDDTVAPGELNFLGGHGKLYPIVFDNSYGIECIADEDNWYINGTRRISKTARDENGKPKEELLCQVAGCSHTNEEDCLVAQYSNRLLVGQDEVYYWDTNAPSFIKGCIGQFKRILSDGSLETVIPAPDKFLASENHIVSQVYFTSVMALGDTGIYYVEANMSDSEHFRNMRILADSRTGDIMELSDGFHSASPAQYDEKTGHLFLFETYENQRKINGRVNAAGEIITDSETRYNPGICEIDIYTGEEISRHEMQFDNSWFIRDNALHMLSAPQESSVNSFVNWFRIDLSTGEKTQILENCHFNSIMSCGDYVYAARHAAVGNDAIVRMQPDGSGETVIMETAGIIHSLIPTVNDELLFILTDTGIPFAVLPDGSTVQITY
jgi:hypothetical protein